MEVCCTCEPGGTPLGIKLREILQDPGVACEPLAEALLYSADRVQHLAEVIRPALFLGQVVVCDRFIDSTIAYQGFGRRLDMEVVRGLVQLAAGGLAPDLTLLLDVSPEVGLERKRLAGKQYDRLEAEDLDFHRRVREGYLRLAAEAPERFWVVDASRSIEEVHLEVVRAYRARWG